MKTGNAIRGMPRSRENPGSFFSNVCFDGLAPVGCRFLQALSVLPSVHWPVRCGPFCARRYRPWRSATKDWWSGRKPDTLKSSTISRFPTTVSADVQKNPWPLDTVCRYRWTSSTVGAWKRWRWSSPVETHHAPLSPPTISTARMVGTGLSAVCHFRLTRTTPGRVLQAFNDCFQKAVIGFADTTIRQKASSVQWGLVSPLTRFYGRPVQAGG